MKAGGQAGGQAGGRRAAGGRAGRQAGGLAGGRAGCACLLVTLLRILRAANLLTALVPTRKMERTVTGYARSALEMFRNSQRVLQLSMMTISLDFYVCRMRKLMNVRSVAASSVSKVSNTSLMNLINWIVDR